MRVRLSCSGGMHKTPWKKVPEHGHVIFERTEFGERRDLPTDFVVEVEPKSEPKKFDPTEPRKLY